MENEQKPTIWDSFPATRQDIRRMLGNLRDKRDFAPELRERMIVVIRRETNSKFTDDELPGIAKELLENRHRVQYLVNAFNKRETTDATLAD